MSISDLTGTKWRFDKVMDFVEWSGSNAYKNIWGTFSTQYGDLSYTTNNYDNYRFFRWRKTNSPEISNYIAPVNYSGGAGGGRSFYMAGMTGVVPYPTVNGQNRFSTYGYVTLEILGGNDATNAEFIAWLEANATQQLPIDLSTTMWRFSDTPTLSNVGTFDLDFTSNNTDYNSLTIASDGLSYGNTLAYGSTGYDVSCSLTWPEGYGEDWVGCGLSISGTGCITDPSDFDGNFTYGETASRAFNADGQVLLTISSGLSTGVIGASFNGNALTFTSPDEGLTHTATINVTQNSTLAITAYGFD